MPIEPTHALKKRIKTLENVIVVEDGEIIEQRLDETMQLINITTKPSNHVALCKETSKMVQLNESTRNSFLSLDIPSNKTFKKPLHLFFIANKKAVVHKTAIHVAENTQFKLFESVTGYGDQTINYVSDTHLEADAQLTYTTLSSGDKSVASAIVRNAALKARAVITYTNGVFTNGTTNQENHVLLNGAAAEGIAKTIALTSDTQETLIKTTVEHLAPKSKGLIEHYGVANDASTLIFEGVGKIHKNMRQSEARQSNKGVVIGAQARLDANPLLLIDEHDVEAGHGAAIGRIDEDQLYYLMSRGLNLREAEKLIINGYVAPLQKIIESETIKEHVNTLLSQKIQ